MAADLDARRVGLSYEGGTATAAFGLWKYLFGSGNAVWTCPTNFPVDIRGRRRFPKGTKQRKNTAGGRTVYLQLDEGGIYTVRYTGALVDFLKNVVCKAGSKIVDAWSERGTTLFPDEYAPTGTLNLMEG